MFFYLFSFCLNKQSTLENDDIINCKNITNNVLNNNFDINDLNILLDTSNSIGNWLDVQNTTNESQHLSSEHYELINQYIANNIRANIALQLRYEAEKRLYQIMFLLGSVFAIIFLLFDFLFNFVISFSSFLFFSLINMLKKRLRSH